MGLWEHPYLCTEVTGVFVSSVTTSVSSLWIVQVLVLPQEQEDVAG